MLTAKCPKCRGRFVVVRAAPPCRCDLNHGPGACPTATSRNVLRRHQPCGQHVRPLAGTEEQL